MALTLEERARLNQEIQRREAKRFKEMIERQKYSQAYGELCENPGLVSKLTIYDAGQFYRAFKEYDRSLSRPKNYPGTADVFLKIVGDMLNVDDIGAPLEEEREMQEIQISRRKEE